jgi:hypothetical protein
MVNQESLAPTGEGRLPLPGLYASRGEVLLRGAVLALGAGILCAALVLKPAAPGAGRLRLGGFFLPETCALKATTGIPCPGCGLTRSWVSAVHGDAAGSLGHHPLGWLVLLYALAQGARHGAWLAAPRRRGAVERLGARLDRGVILLGVLLLVAWIPRLILILRQAV